MSLVFSNTIISKWIGFSLLFSTPGIPTFFKEKEIVHNDILAY